MRTLKATTKRAQYFIDAHRMSSDLELYDVYNKPSQAKLSAFNWCREQCAKEGGKYFRVISAGTFTFSVGWYTEEGLRVETAQNSYLITF